MSGLDFELACNRRKQVAVAFKYLCEFGQVDRMNYEMIGGFLGSMKGPSVEAQNMKAH
jgi:hypothetical protein